MRTVHLRLHVPDKTAADVYRTLADFERYPHLCDAVQSVAVSAVCDATTVSRWEVTFRAGLLRWTEEDHFDRDALTITFRQLEGDVALFDGTSAWTRPAAATSRSLRDLTWGSPAWPTRSNRSRRAP